MALLFRLILAALLTAGAYSTALADSHEQDGEQQQEQDKGDEQQQEEEQEQEEQKQDVIALSPEDLVWTAAPSHFEPGAEWTNIQGDLMAPGLATVRLRFPAGYEIRPHYHGEAELVTILSGELAFGKGETMDMNETETYGAGAFIQIPAGKAHFVRAETDVEIQINIPGVFTMIYIDPADDPRER